MKILIIIVLAGFLIYLLVRRFMLVGAGNTTLIRGKNQHFVLIDTSPQLLRRVTTNTITTVGIGFLLLLAVLVLGIKIKILWILIPLCLYLIGQVFVYTNHMKTVRDQQIYFNPQTYEVIVDYVKGSPLSFHIMRDVRQVSEIKSVQKNRGVLFGYYKLYLKQRTVCIPYLIEQNETNTNNSFFSCLNNNFRIEVEKKLFPII